MPENNVCIVGAGPAGVVLGLLLAKQGIQVTVLESQSDFDRDFRGDTLHASSLEIFDQLGLAESILKLSNGRLDKFKFDTADSKITIADFAMLETAFPFVALIPQEKFLGFLSDEASKIPGFQLLLNAKVTGLISDSDQIKGVFYKHEGQEKKLNACLTIGADGRGSTVRQKANIKLGKTSPPMDVIWFKLPHSDDIAGQVAKIHFGSGSMLVMIDRGDEWQLGFVVIKGSYKSLREKGIEAFHNELLQLVPELEKSLHVITDWSQCAILSVVTGRVEKWYQPGLLLIGDAAHVMSPVGGVGINYAIQDAVATANLITGPLKKGNVTESDLAAVQQQRQRATRFIQTVQAFIQKRIIANALKTDKPFKPPLPIRILSRFSFFQRVTARVMAYGLKPEIIKYPE